MIRLTPRHVNREDLSPFPLPDKDLPAWRPAAKELAEISRLTRDWAKGARCSGLWFEGPPEVEWDPGDLVMGDPERVERWMSHPDDRVPQALLDVAFRAKGPGRERHILHLTTEAIKRARREGVVSDPVLVSCIDKLAGCQGWVADGVAQVVDGVRSGALVGREKGGVGQEWFSASRSR